jgi:hypothetical protein
MSGKSVTCRTIHVAAHETAMRTPDDAPLEGCMARSRWNAAQREGIIATR